MASVSSVTEKSTNVRTYRRPPQAPRPVRASIGFLSRVAPDAATGLMTRLFMRPPPSRPLRTEAARVLATGHRTELLTRLGRLTAWRWGNANRRALLIHGWGGRGTQLIPFLGPLREQGLEVWMIDLPGHGDSRGRALALPEAAELLRETVVLLGGLQALVAHSFGATAAALASRDGPLAARMALIAPPGDMRRYTRLFAEAFGFPDRVHDRMLQRFQERYGVPFETLRLDAHRMEQPAPTLIVHDVDDESVPFRHGLRLHDAWAGTRLMRTEGLGHKGVLRDAAVVDEVTRFVSG